MNATASRHADNAPLAPRTQDPFGLQIRQVEELLQFTERERALHRTRVVGLDVLGLIEFGDHLTEDGAKQSAAVFIPVIGRVGRVVEEELHVGLVGPHGAVGAVEDPTQMTEEVIGIGRRPLPRSGADEVCHPQDDGVTPMDRAAGGALRQLCAPPAGQHVFEERLGIRTRRTRRQVHQPTHRIVHAKPPN